MSQAMIIKGRPKKQKTTCLSETWSSDETCKKILQLLMEYGRFVVYHRTGKKPTRNLVNMVKYENDPASSSTNMSEKDYNKELEQLFKKINRQETKYLFLRKLEAQVKPIEGELLEEFEQISDRKLKGSIRKLSVILSEEFLKELIELALNMNKSSADETLQLWHSLIEKKSHPDQLEKSHSIFQWKQFEELREKYSSKSSKKEEKSAEKQQKLLRKLYDVLN